MIIEAILETVADLLWIGTLVILFIAAICVCVWHTEKPKKFYLWLTDKDYDENDD